MGSCQSDSTRTTQAGRADWLAGWRVDGKFALLLLMQTLKNAKGRGGGKREKVLRGLQVGSSLGAKTGLRN
jgi:hypothetical protein